MMGGEYTIVKILNMKIRIYVLNLYGGDLIMTLGHCTYCKLSSMLSMRDVKEREREREREIER